MREGDDKEQVSREPKPIPYWTPGRKGFFLGAGGTALFMLALLWLGWAKPFWM